MSEPLRDEATDTVSPMALNGPEGTVHRKPEDRLALGEQSALTWAPRERTGLRLQHRPRAEQRTSVRGVDLPAPEETYRNAVSTFRRAVRMWQSRSQRPGTGASPARPEQASASQITLAPLASQVRNETHSEPRPREVGSLTPRQREIAGLIAAGLTNSEIAAELVLSTGTVANHVEHILNRLGCRSRARIAAWAVQHGLGPPGSDH